MEVNKKQNLEIIIAVTRGVIAAYTGSILGSKQLLEQCNDDGTPYISSEEKRLKIKDKILRYERKINDKQKELEQYIRELGLLE